MPVFVTKFLGKYVWHLGVAALFALLLTITYCSGRSTGSQKEVNNQLERTIEVDQNVSTANDKAADARVQDSVTLEQQKQELKDAIDRGEDADTLRFRRGCIILRQQNRDSAATAACSRFETELRARVSGGSAPAR